MARKKQKRFKLKPRFYYFLATLVVVIFSVVLIINSSKDEEIKKTIKFHDEIYEMYINDERSIGYTISNSDEFDKITWSTTNTNIASVNANGLVKGISFGDVTITARLENGSSSSVKVRIKSYDVSLRLEVNKEANDSWYNENIDVKIITSNIKNYKYCVTKEETCEPNTTYNKPINFKNGIWTIYIEGIDNNNKEISHREIFKVDTIKPKCIISKVGKLTDATTSVAVSCEPDASRVFKYVWYRDKMIIYTTDRNEILMEEIMEEGNHSYMVKVYDNALNETVYNIK